MLNETLSQKFHVYSILSTKTKYESVEYCVLMMYTLRYVE